MKNRSKHLFNKPLPKSIFLPLLAVANLSALVLSMLYLAKAEDNLSTNIFGFYIILVLISNSIAAVNNLQFSYGYLIYSSFSSLLVPILNTVASSDPTNTTSRSSFAIILILTGFAAGFICFGYGTFNNSKKKSPIRKPDTRLKFLMRLILLLLSGIILISGIFVCYDLLTRKYAGIFEVFLPEYSFFFGLYFLSIAAFAVKLSKYRYRIYSWCMGMLGILLFVILCLPILSVPKLLYNANKEYTQAFGGVTQSTNVIPEFKKIAFSVPQYFFGTVSGDYTVQENIQFYEGTQGVDQGITLYFDVYQPTQDISKLPGKGSALIRIHGGAWNIGDKGSSNYTQVNKYFASLGYVVFDIQYGLNNQGKFVSYAPVPGNVQGEFTIDDMVRHIGIFTTYLCDHKGDYGVNTDSVFISGGSAGGQLTVAVGLALSNGDYSEILDPRINVKGIIPFYPADGLARIGGKKELVDPALLVDKNSPPCLIYQGTKDGIVDPQIAKDLKYAYTQNGNEKCSLIMMPLASHGSDFYFSSYYNQVFIYYMERFMLENQYLSNNFEYKMKR